MPTRRPVTRLPIGAAPGKRPGLRVFCLSILGVGLGAAVLCAAAFAAPPKTAPAQAADPSQFVGSETCATCHDDVAKGFASNPHTKMALMHGDKGVTCENCHGPGKAHVDGGGDATKIFDPAKATSAQVDQTCLKCHASSHPNFERSPHAKANVGCASCHSIHHPDQRGAVRAALHMNDNIRAGSGDAARYLLRAPQPTLCFQCHADQKSQFNMPFHHQVPEGLISCSDCHDPHGTFQNNNLRITADQNMVCVKCHTDVRGPFVYEHAPVKAEGCMACHTPHGSQNPRLLNMPNINVLCNQCHSAVAVATIHGQGQGSSDSVPCTSCHTYIHGSNMNAAFLR